MLEYVWRDDGISLESLCEVVWQHSVVMNVTILRARCKTHAIWMECNAMYCTEVTFNVGEHFIIDNIVQLHVETTFLCTSSCYILSILTAA